MRALSFHLAGILLVLAPANATVEGPCTFYQPIITYDVGVSVCPVTYTCQFDTWSSPGYRVIRTFAENHVGTMYGFENRNAASLAGLRCELVQWPGTRPQNEFHGLFGDTLRVNVIVPPADSLFASSKRFNAQWAGILPEVLEVTISCMKVNASGEYPRFKFLSIEVQGSPSDSALGGVFPVEAPAKDSMK